MSSKTQRHEITKKRVLYQIPGMEAVTIRRDVQYLVTSESTLTLDIYYPPEAQNGRRAPAIIFVFGYPDVGFQKILGCTQKEMESFVSWAQLVAVSGIAAITYETKEPAADLNALLQYVRQNAESLGIEEDMIGLWACSGHVPNALSFLMREDIGHLKCAALCYGYTLDLDGSTGIAEAAKQYGFVNPCAGKSVNDLPQNIPLFIVRAGRDQMPHLNETLDLFLVRALGCNLPITFANHTEAPHAFDLFHDSAETREIIRQILAFMRFHLLR